MKFTDKLDKGGAGEVEVEIYLYPSLGREKYPVVSSLEGGGERHGEVALDSGEGVEEEEGGEGGEKESKGPAVSRSGCVSKVNLRSSASNAVFFSLSNADGILAGWCSCVCAHFRLATAIMAAR